MLVGDLDLAEPVADLGIDAEDAPDVHVALEGGLHRAQLDLPVLGHGGHPGGETAGQADQQDLDGCRALVLGRESSGWSPSKLNSARCVCSAPRPKKPLTLLRLWVPLTQVLDTRHLKLAASGWSASDPPGGLQELNVYSIVDGGSGVGHSSYLQTEHGRLEDPGR